MTGARILGLLLSLAVCLRGTPASAQAVTDFSDPRFPYAVAVRRLEVLEAAWREAASADVLERAAWEERARGLEGDLAELRGRASTVPDPHPLARGGSALAALAGSVAEERARLSTLQVLQDELRVFLGYLRVFDETGMPPSARAESGGSGDPGCPVTSCATEPIGVGGAPALEHFQRGGKGTGQAGNSVTLTSASLDRLHALLLAHSGGEALESARAGRRTGTVVREMGTALGLVGFRRQGESSAGINVKAAAGLHHARSIGGGVQLALEPWVGARSVRLDPVSSAEVAAEVREALSGSLDQGPSWQITSWQKGRTLTDPLPPPAYLEPGRLEGGAAARLSIPVRSSWALEVGGGGDGVRYGPAEWKPMDRQGLNAVVAATRASPSASARVSLLAARHGFPHEAGHRADTRLGVGADWSVEGRAVLRLSVGVARNDSGLPAYDYRTGRAAVVVSAPWGANSLQGYGALAVQRYANPGAEDRRVAPSDQDTGSLLALQLTRRLGSTRALTLRAEWARSVTGFGSEFYHRFGTSLQVAFRGLAER